MVFDDLDIKILKENFDEDIIDKIDIENVSKIYFYLKENGIYYAKDLFLNSLLLFLLPVDQFQERFEKLKRNLGEDYVEKLAEDASLIEFMYQD